MAIHPRPPLRFVGLAAMTTLMAACVLSPWGTNEALRADGSGASAPGGGGSGGVGPGGGQTGDGAGGTGGASSNVGGAGGASTSGSGGSAGAGGMGGSPPTGPVCNDGVVDWMAGEQCDDGNNNPGDGCSASCTYELSNECPAHALVVGTTKLTFTGNTSGNDPDVEGSCGGGSADEIIFRVQAGASGTLQATLTSQQYSVVLWARSDCPGGQELSCDDTGPAILSRPVNMGDTIILGVDGNGGQEGEFLLEMEIVP